MAQKTYESYQKLPQLEKVRNIVKWFKQGVVSTDELKKKAERKLIQSVKIKWNSTFYMLEIFLELREVVAGIVNFNKSAPPMPFPGEIEFCT
ncbi:hypothetical protein NPIL_620341 [Nephila pilipes]|uniref:Uncharacterized protein n=1 Tax=Nephila pilipes TaxID=299642 RepID=A0A8X6SZT6_NEPPI|nr:hypothetical protein NPIL_620341 [Nephila pilipes]